MLFRSQRDWLLKRTDANGFSVPLEDNGRPAVDVVARAQDTFHRPRGKRVTLSRATFEGVLQVEDPSALRAALTHGIGPAKAYGCGLMTLAPLDLREV